MAETDIQWTHIPGYRGESWNPLAAYRKSDGKRGWHCTKVNPACAHCYAEVLNLRLGTGLKFNKASAELIEMRLVNLDTPTRATKPRCYFTASMTDLFGEFVSDEQLHCIIHEMLDNRRHLFLTLTKRWDRMQAFLSEHYPNMDKNGAHCWWGVSAGRQEDYNAAAEALVKTPAAIRFVSYEPALEEIDFERGTDNGIGLCWSILSGQPTHVPYCDYGAKGIEPGIQPHIDWIIYGGESGKSARLANIEWARSTIAQCKAAGISPFVKQLGAAIIAPVTTNWPNNPDFRSDDDLPAAILHFKLRDSHGGDPSEWPVDLRVREFPKVTR